MPCSSSLTAMRIPDNQSSPTPRSSYCRRRTCPEAYAPGPFRRTPRNLVRSRWRCFSPCPAVPRPDSLQRGWRKAHLATLAHIHRPLRAPARMPRAKRQADRPARAVNVMRCPRLRGTGPVLIRRYQARNDRLKRVGLGRRECFERFSSRHWSQSDWGSGRGDAWRERSLRNRRRSACHTQSFERLRRDRPTRVSGFSVSFGIVSSPAIFSQIGLNHPDVASHELIIKIPLAL
jgi:hypothetical protein